jgi:uncharacterized protein (TIGR03084 family)
MMATADRSVLEDLTAEQTDLHRLLRQLDDGDWSCPTPAAGWQVRDQVAHLAHTEELARDTATGGPASLDAEIARYGGDGQAMIDAGAARSRDLAPSELLDWWCDAAAANRRALAAADVAGRVPWGLGMSWRAFVTARLMEHWAHGLDIRVAANRPGVDTARLRHVAWIATSALPYAFTVAGAVPPVGRSLLVEVTPPPGASVDREVWTFGPADASDRLTGPAGQWCRRAVQRATVAETPDLRAEGPLAELALAHARAFL